MYRVFALVCVSALLSFAVGCGPAEKPAAKPAPDKPAAPEHEAHTHGAGPHGGIVIDWGGGAYHVEFTVDHAKKEATVYILGDDEKTPTPIKAEKIHLSINEPALDLDLAATPLEGEAAGTSSRFVGTHDSLGVEQAFAGTISGEIGGTPYTGDFKEEPAK